MSGRARPNLRDGQWIGYRKTDRRNPRRERAEPSEYRLILQLPRRFQWSTSPGQHGSFVEIGPMNNVTVRSFDREVTLRKAAEFLQGIGKGVDYEALSAVMQTRDGHDTVQIVLRRNDVIMWYGPAKPIFFAA